VTNRTELIGLTLRFGDGGPGKLATATGPHFTKKTPTKYSHKENVLVKLVVPEKKWLQHGLQQINRKGRQEKEGKGGHPKMGLGKEKGVWTNNPIVTNSKLKRPGRGGDLQ